MAYSRKDLLEDTVMSIQASLSDLERWNLQCAFGGGISADRKSDMRYHANRILELVERL